MRRPSSGMVDSGLAVGASRLVNASLGVVPGEHVLVVFDEAHREIADVIHEAIQVASAHALMFKLEDLGPRPHERLASSVLDAMRTAQASVLLASFHDGELAMRTEMIEAAESNRLRHGHMIGVTRASMIAGFAVNPRRIAEKMHTLMSRLRPAGRIAVRSTVGTDLSIELSPGLRWLEFGATVNAGKRVNLPGGELVTCPAAVDGTYVADGTLGDAEGTLGRSLHDAPVTLRIVASRVRAVECPVNPALARTLSQRMARFANLDRVGLAGFGVNIGLIAPLGDVFTDQKVPGVHLSLGESFSDKTGATWTSKSWIAMTTTQTDVDVDKQPVLRQGRFLI